jgi:glutathione S-transferase
MQAISHFLGKKPYLMGDTPCTVDATLYGMLGNVLDCRLESPLNQFARSQSNLVAYTERMQARYFAKQEEAAISA